MEEKRIFNLLKPIQKPKDYWDNIYDWIVFRARIIVLISEILIVIAFGAKIFVDNTGSNREDDYDQLNIDLKFLETTYESDFRRLQSKDVEYRKLWDSSSVTSKIMDEVLGYIPSPTDEFTIKIDGDAVTIFGFGNLDTVRQLESSLKNSATFQDAFLDLDLSAQDISSNQGQFTITAIIKQDIKERTQLL